MGGACVTEVEDGGKGSKVARTLAMQVQIAAIGQGGGCIAQEGEGNISKPWGLYQTLQ